MKYIPWDAFAIHSYLTQTLKIANRCIPHIVRLQTASVTHCVHDGVIKWKHFPSYWPFVRRIHRSPVNSPHKGQWRGALMFSLICVWMNGLVNTREAGDLRRHRAHYDVIVMLWLFAYSRWQSAAGRLLYLCASTALIFLSNIIKIMRNVRVLSNHERALLAHPCTFGEKIARFGISWF